MRACCAKLALVRRGKSRTQPRLPPAYLVPMDEVLKLKFDSKKRYPGQLAPSIPAREDLEEQQLEGGVAKGAAKWQVGTAAEGQFLVINKHIIVQRGPFGSVWLRLTHGDEGMASQAHGAKLLSHFASHIVHSLCARNEGTVDMKQHLRLAVYVCFRERGVRSALAHAAAKWFAPPLSTSTPSPSPPVQRCGAPTSTSFTSLPSSFIMRARYVCVADTLWSSRHHHHHTLRALA